MAWNYISNKKPKYHGYQYFVIKIQLEIVFRLKKPLNRDWLLTSKVFDYQTYLIIDDHPCRCARLHRSVVKSRRHCVHEKRHYDEHMSHCRFVAPDYQHCSWHCGHEYDLNDYHGRFCYLHNRHGSLSYHYRINGISGYDCCLHNSTYCLFLKIFIWTFQDK